MKSLFSRLWSSTWLNPVLLLGLLLMTGYWVSVKPIAGYPGYSEDLCFSDVLRQLMSQQVKTYGKPTFTTDEFMTPAGASVPYMSWSIERDWLGSKFWDLDHGFPYLWAYFGVSLLLTYLGVGWLIGRMGLRPAPAWGIAALVVIFHVPRHFKVWHHFEHLPQHWIYWSLFLDAWIWQRFQREKRLSLTMECWRGLLMIGTLGTTGYFWGALILEWMIVRACLLIGLGIRRRRGTAIRWEGSVLSAAVPVVIGLATLILYLRWFLPLQAEVKKLGEVFSGLWWFANLAQFFRPLWLELFLPATWTLPPIDGPETVVSVGWLYWIPTLLGLWLVRKRKSGPGVQAVLPFLILLIVAMLYTSLNGPLWVQDFLQATVPFMRFFRVASRWGLFMPQFLTILILLCWPELSAWCRTRFGKTAAGSRPRLAWVLLAVFLVTSALEFRWLSHPVTMQPPLTLEFTAMMGKIRDLPGTTVLNLPFCVTGGNGVCGEQCPNYPASTATSCLRLWHEKKIYGLYMARMVWSHCDNYKKPPFLSWFDAWKTQRCFTENEWTDFCQYLEGQPNLSAVLLSPDIWTGAGQPACLAEFDRRLGAPLGTERFFNSPVRGGAGVGPTRVVWYGPKCRK